MEGRGMDVPWAEGPERPTVVADRRSSNNGRSAGPGSLRNLVEFAFRGAVWRSRVTNVKRAGRAADPGPALPGFRSIVP